MTAVPGDGKVTLYWDRVAEESLDPVTKEKDFQGYKIYRPLIPILTMYAISRMLMVLFKDTLLWLSLIKKMK